MADGILGARGNSGQAAPVPHPPNRAPDPGIEFVSAVVPMYLVEAESWQRRTVDIYRSDDLQKTTLVHARSDRAFEPSEA